MSDELTQSLIPAEISPYDSERFGHRSWQGIAGIEYDIHSKCFFATWYSGGKDECPENFALLAASKDGGDTWSNELAVVHTKSPVRVYDEGLWRSPEGDLYWYWAQSVDKFDGRAGVWLAKAKPGRAGVPDFETPQRIANGIMMNKPTVMRNSGLWCYPTAVWGVLDRILTTTTKPVLYPDDYRKEAFSNVLVSADRGKTFKLILGPDIPERSYDEHMVMERSDGSWALFVRTFYGIAVNFSYDQGKTWQPWVANPRVMEGNIKDRLYKKDYGDTVWWRPHTNYGYHNVFRVGPCTRFFIRTLPSGRWVLIFHDHPNIRKCMTAYISEDEGKTWPYSMVIDERNDVSYPDGTILDDGLIYVVYDHGRYAEKEILCARFTEEDVLAGTIRDSRSRLKILINNAS